MYKKTLGRDSPSESAAQHTPHGCRPLPPWWPVPSLVHDTIYEIQNTLSGIQYAVHKVRNTKYIIRNTKYIIRNTLSEIQYT